ncbi:beta-fructofuranosidase [Ranunculus cassubicifolius]
MADMINPFSSYPDLENEYPSSSSSYTNLPADQNEIPNTTAKRSTKGYLLTVLLFSFMAFVLVMIRPDQSTLFDALLIKDESSSSFSSTPAEKVVPFIPRGVAEGVSAKSSPDYGEPFPWTTTMLSWQRTAYHFQSAKNWMSDPDGPMLYKGWYHFFYQYNPGSAVWGNITWGHAVSRDLINWFYLPIAIVPGSWYDVKGVWSGSATILPDGNIVMTYTSSTKESVQVQNVAYPANHSDPLLIEWVKYSGNPILFPPPGIGTKDFRDPSTAWLVSGKWQIAVGSQINGTGVAVVYETTDFLNYKLLDGLLHEVPFTGMWACVDLYPVSTTDANGLDTSVNGPGIKHVLKVSLDDSKKDLYALGTYDSAKNTWTPDNPELDVGIGIRYDYGNYYAAKSFYDHNKGRRIVWGWIGETDSEIANIRKGWSGVQAIPREVTLDMKTKTNIIQWPIEEVESLRLSSEEFKETNVPAGSIIPLDVSAVAELDIIAEIEIDGKALESIIVADVMYNCSTSGGSAGRGALGPFGLLVYADESLSEQTAIYFYIAKGTDGSLKTYFCTDTSRTSKANDIGKKVYGGIVPVLDGEKFSMRILVDHSAIETFAQNGRTCVSSRVYPTKAIRGAARLFLFNNATETSVTVTSLKVWQLASANMQDYRSVDMVDTQ